MSERITDERVRFLASRVSGMRYGASGTQAEDTTWDDTHAALTELLALRKDQADWRKGVGLIASALGENKPADLCCVRIANVALALRAEVERLRAVEKAARELTQWANTRSICPVCKAEVTFTGWKGHHPPCRLRQLSAALTANKQEPTT